ncbi:MAG: DUF2946 family protein [Gammaproteobacteria bacterium]|nr:DUF2946 family protein [Gammaproteobacteria bacterium]
MCYRLLAALLVCQSLLGAVVPHGVFRVMAGSAAVDTDARPKTVLCTARGLLVLDDEQTSPGSNPGTEAPDSSCPVCQLHKLLIAEPAFAATTTIAQAVPSAATPWPRTATTRPRAAGPGGIRAPPV